MSHEGDGINVVTLTSVLWNAAIFTVFSSCISTKWIVSGVRQRVGQSVL